MVIFPFSINSLKDHVVCKFVDIVPPVISCVIVPVITVEFKGSVVNPFDIILSFVVAFTTLFLPELINVPSIVKSPTKVRVVDEFTNLKSLGQVLPLLVIVAVAVMLILLVPAIVYVLFNVKFPAIDNSALWVMVDV